MERIGSGCRFHTELLHDYLMHLIENGGVR